MSANGMRAALGWYAALATGTALLLRQITDPDIWFYLVVGRQVLATGSIPTQEFYLFTAAGDPAVYTGWGFGLLHMLAQQASGYAGMALLNALIGAGALCFAAAAARTGCDGAGRNVGAALAVLGAYLCMDFRLVYRPETTLFLGLGATLWLLERQLERDDRRGLWWVPAIGWLLAQLHTTSIFIVAVLGAYFLQWCWDRRGRLRAGALRRSLLEWGACLALAIVLPAVNPNGLAQVLVLVRGFSDALASDWNVEYLPALKTELRWHFIGAVLAGAAAWLLSSRRRLVDLLIAGAFGILAFLFVRNLALFAFALVVPVGRAIGLGWSRLADRLQPPAARGGSALLIGAAAACAVAFTATGGNWGTGPKPGVFPERAAALIRSSMPAGNVMNFFHLGSYLEWSLGSGYRVGIDGHFVRHHAALDLHDAIFRADSGWQDELAARDVRAIVTPVTLPYSGQWVPLVSALATSPDWRLVASEPAALTFLRENVAGAAARLPADTIWRQAVLELQDTLRDYPEQAAGWRNLAEAHARLGAREAALSAYREYIRLEPGDTSFGAQLGLQPER